MGCSERKARDYAVITAALGYARKYGTASYGEGIFSPWIDKDADTCTDAAQEAIGVQADELEAMQKDLEEAQRARKSAAQECQALRHELAVLKKKQEETESLVASLQGQVADRDLLISAYEEGAERAEGTDAEDEAADAVGFPFRTEMKAVLYGGFPQFHREIEKLFPGIRIVPPTAHLDMSVFQTADVIFIQINCTNHSNCWNVVSTAKAFGVPYYHLDYANPKRCALKMVKKIRKEMEERI